MATGALDDDSDAGDVVEVFRTPRSVAGLNYRWRKISGNLSDGWTKRVVGSSNIPLMCLLCAVVFGSALDKKHALAMLHEYADAAILGGLWHLKEQGSATYTGMTFGTWIGVILFSGDDALATKFRILARQWLALAHAQAVGSEVIWSGFRGWNHGDAASYYYRRALGIVKANPKDGRDFSSNAAFEAEIQRLLADVESDPWSFVVCGTFKPWYFAHYADGVKVSYFDEDIPEEPDPEGGADHEFQGISTPSQALVLGIGGKYVQYPPFPNPLDGADRLRMGNIGTVDVDGDPEHGWKVYHSVVGPKGAKPDANGRYVFVVPRPTSAPLVLWKRLDSTGLHDVRRTEPVPTPEPTPTPNPSPGGQQTKSGCALLGLFK